jgi:Cleft lip and palate transmembrane protein 1 (CLPTM1)
MLGQGFGILLEMWKVTKTVNIRIQRTNSLIPYTVIFEDKHVLTETEADTQKYDKIAFVCFTPTVELILQTYMYWGGIPLLLSYAVYSLYYEEHKSWYSYTITTLVGFVYAWGFLMMVLLLQITLTSGSRIVYQLSSPFSRTHATSYNGL